MSPPRKDSSRRLFQLTASQGGWQTVNSYSRAITNFNSQPHKEADNSCTKLSAIVSYFNSQPHKEADFNGYPSEWWAVHFNSQPHKEADSWPSYLLSINRISTHSLTRRLTKIVLHGGVRNIISTHSLTRRLTRAANAQAWYEYFISTHSLTRRLTSSTQWSVMVLSYFNSQPHKEADGLISNYSL